MKKDEVCVADCSLDRSGIFSVSSTTRKQVMRDMPKDEAVAELLLPFENAVSGNMKKVIGETSVPLDSCNFSLTKNSKCNK